MQYLDVKLKRKNIQTFMIQTAIQKAIDFALPHFRGKLLDIGCGSMPYKNYIIKNSKVDEYIGLDIESALIYDNNVKPDYRWDGKEMPFKNETFDCAFGTEVLEHCPDTELILGETNRVLKKGGVFFFTVPFLVDLHEVPNDQYRFTPYSIKRHLANSGFTNIAVLATGGWHYAMAQYVGLWIKFAPMNIWVRRFFFVVGLVVIKVLHVFSKKENIDFSGKKRQMIAGLYGIAFKS